MGCGSSAANKYEAASKATSRISLNALPCSIPEKYLECASNYLFQSRTRFDKIDANQDGTLDVKEITAIWAAALEESTRLGRPLSQEERLLLEAQVQETFAEMDILGTGSITLDEWVHHALMSLHSPGAADVKAISLAIKGKAGGAQEALKQLVQLWEQYDVDCSGHLSASEFSKLLQDRKANTSEFVHRHSRKAVDGKCVVAAAKELQSVNSMDPELALQTRLELVSSIDMSSLASSRVAKETDQRTRAALECTNLHLGSKKFCLRWYHSDGDSVCRSCSQSFSTSSAPRWCCAHHLKCEYYVCELCFEEALKVAVDIIAALPEGWQDVDANDSGVVCYAEFCAFELGLEWEPVELYYYDLVGPFSKLALAGLTGSHEEGIWHTSIVAFGCEFYFYIWIIEQTPGQTEFGTPTKKLMLGKTLWKELQFRTYAIEELDPIFTTETYDFLDSNCNHVSDRIAMFLLGCHIPQDALGLSDRLRKSSTVRAARPLIQRKLGGEDATQKIYIFQNQKSEI